MLTYFFKTKIIVNTSESTCFALLWSRRLDIDDGFKCVRNRLFDVVLAFSSLLVSAMVLSTSVPISDSLRNCCSMSSVFLKTSSLFEMFLEGDLSTKAWLSNPALSTVDCYVAPRKVPNEITHHLEIASLPQNISAGTLNHDLNKKKVITR